MLKFQTCILNRARDLIKHLNLSFYIYFAAQTRMWVRDFATRRFKPRISVSFWCDPWVVIEMLVLHDSVSMNSHLNPELELAISWRRTVQPTLPDLNYSSDMPYIESNLTTVGFLPSAYDGGQPNLDQSDLSTSPDPIESSAPPTPLNTESIIDQIDEEIDQLAQDRFASTLSQSEEALLESSEAAQDSLRSASEISDLSQVEVATDSEAVSIQSHHSSGDNLSQDLENQISGEMSASLQSTSTVRRNSRASDLE